ncbi:MAG: hypothetical protein P4L16_02400 [Chlamydiales bacterium]|nr:hypothetical protein [Chlamydiales bacterium]
MKFFVLFLLLLCKSIQGYSNTAWDQDFEPWWSGTLLTSPGVVEKAGHITNRTFFYYQNECDKYDSHWNRIQNAHFVTMTYRIQTFVGLVKNIDLESDVYFLRQETHQQKDANISNFQLRLAYQILKEQENSLKPNCLVFVREIFPLGKHEHLNPSRLKTDGTSDGCFYTVFGLYAEKVFKNSKEHSLRVVGNFNYGIRTNRVSLSGYNFFGGDYNTKGTILPGNYLILTLGIEQHLTKHLEFVLDLSYQHVNKNSFYGFAGTTPLSPATINTNSIESITIVPTIAYNFNKHMHLELGVITSIAGRNTSAIYTPSIVFKANW